MAEFTLYQTAVDKAGNPIGTSSEVPVWIGSEAPTDPSLYRYVIVNSDNDPNSVSVDEWKAATGNKTSAVGGDQTQHILFDAEAVNKQAGYYLTTDPYTGGTAPKSLTNNFHPVTVCFTAGTMIETEAGPRAVESLSVGDLVRTRDNGLQPVRWIEAVTERHLDIGERRALRPIRIAAGALGGGKPETDLVVSPWHRVLVRSEIAREMCGSDEVLVAARNLTDLDGVEVVEDATEVTYVHFMCDRHEVVFSNGAETETLNIGLSTAERLSPESYAEILRLFPALAQGPQPTVRPALPGQRGRRLVSRHLEAGLPLAG